MGVLQNPLGINLTNNQPVKNTPFVNSSSNGGALPPPGSDVMITESGIIMITESSFDVMITE
jgi:hypothetical protein